MKDTKVHSMAANETVAAIAYYNAQTPGVGDKFRQAVEATMLQIQRMPLFFPIDVSDYRLVIVSGFPYGIYYKEYDAFVHISAVYHLKRKPDQWLDRQAEA